MRPNYQLPAALLIFVAAAIAVYSFATDPVDPSPTVMVRNGVVNPAGLFVNTNKSVEFYNEQIIRHPDVVDNYVQLSQLYLQLAHETGDERRYVPGAKALIQKALARDPNNYNGRVVEASLLNTLHQFETARERLNVLIGESPQHAFLRGAMVDALVELGEYDSAVAHSDTMQLLKPSLSSYARAAYLRELHGQNDGAIAAMEMAANAGIPGSPDRSWALFQMGNLYLKSGDTKRASVIFDGILQEAPGYSMALAGLASVALAEENFPGALELAESGFSATSRTVFLELKLEALTAMGATDTHHVVDQIEQSYADSEKMGENVDMEYADFLADNEVRLEEAATRIAREQVRRPQHLHVLETSAWVLHKQGRSQEAMPLIKKAMRLGTHDAKLYYRASQIADAAGQSTLAAKWQEQALEYNLKTESITAWQEVNQSVSVTAVTG